MTRLRRPIGIVGVLVVLALLAVAVLASLVPLGLLSALNAFFCALAVAAVVVTTLFARRFRRERRASAAIDFVASRLLSVEARLSALDRPSDLSQPADLAGLTSDITLLSGLIKSLADAMTAQDQEIEDLKAQVARLTMQPALAEPASGHARRLDDGLDHDRSGPIRSAFDAENAFERLSPERLPPDRPAIPDLPPASRAAAGPATITAHGNRIIPSLLPSLDEAAASPVRARIEVDPVASEARRAAITEALNAGRIELHLQPIVSLPQRRTKLYEVLARLRLADTTLLSPAEFMPALERLGRLPQMDRIVVSRALVIAESLASRDSAVQLTCNLSLPTLREPDVMAAIETQLLERTDLASRLVFEIPQRAWRTLPDDATARFERLRALGVAFALDHATDLRFDGIVLGERGITFVKLPADMLLEASRAGDDPGPIGQLLALLAKRGVQVVVERVERENEIPDLLDLDVALAQGFALGAPRAVRPDLALTRAPSRTQPPAAVPDTPEPAPAAPEEVASRPFRSFLRRTA